MATQAFPKRFDFSEAEPRIRQRWAEAKAFEPAYRPDGTVQDARRAKAPPFAMVIPPPNVTGRLHMGHALNNTVQDVIIRQKRMDGFDALWVPGTDHAGIATQTVVKKQLDAEGVDYRELGREAMIERIWAWKAKYGDTILHQLARIGCSCDTSRTRFTMDEGLNLAVRTAFVRLYEAGLIYRGERLVNWCPVDQTALSDDEVEKEDEKGKMAYIRYPFEADPSRHLVVATTRPETLFGDTAVAVHPEHPVFKAYIGQRLRLPLQGRLIPIIADLHADPEKGTGCVKITPAHDPNDWEVGERHGLERINVMNPDATMNEVVPERFQGLNRYACRKKVLEELDELGLLEKIEDHVLAIGRSYRSKQPIEYRVSEQWFVKMAPLAEKALLASGYQKTEDGWEKPENAESGLNFHPPRMEKIYFHWLANIRDWCISRQIWWGHQIPAWIHKETGALKVAIDTPPEVAADPEAWRREEDVLDTWFSSWLWPFSTLGWPEATPDLARYYPTSALSTAKDILFFWVARMNFAGLQFTGKLPYRDVYFHSTITDASGLTMSKSKGNGIDPLHVIEGASVDDLKGPVMEARPSNMKELLNRIEKNHPEGFEAIGADGMRWTLIDSITEGEQVRLSLARFTEGRNFVTKLWNAAGRVITALEAELEVESEAKPSAPVDADTWLLARLDQTIRDTRAALEAYDFGRMAQTLYHFVWDDFAAWALELSKTRLGSEDAAERRGALAVMGSVLADTLRLLHPVVPFVTEELFSRLTGPMTQLALWMDNAPEDPLLMRDAYPKPRAEPNPEIEARFAILQRFVVAVRQLRATSNIKDNVRAVVEVKPLSPSTEPMLKAAEGSVCFLAKLEGIRFVESKAPGHVAQFDKDFELYLDLARYVDLKEELARLDKETAKAQKDLESAQKTLANPKFVNRAPADKVEGVRARARDLEAQIAKLEATRAELAALDA